MDRVGFKSPPQNTQFTKGQSGNPKGRPKGSKNLKTILLKELETQISVQEGGKLKKITKQATLCALRAPLNVAPWRGFY